MRSVVPASNSAATAFDSWRLIGASSDRKNRGDALFILENGFEMKEQFTENVWS